MTTLFLALLGLPALPAPAQEVPEIDDEQASDELAQTLEYFSSHPVNLDHATLPDLSAIPLLYPYEALRMAQYLRSHPGLSDPGMLVRDTVISQDALDGILPYICVDQTAAAAKPLAELRSLSRHTWRGDSAYTALGLSNTQKLRLRPNEHWEITGLTDKDAGDRSFADFYSGGVTFTASGIVRRVLAGDYQLSFAQGLLFGGSGPAFLSAQSLGQIKLNEARVMPNYSTTEWNFLRGAAATAAIPGLCDVTGFASSRPGAGGERLAGLRMESGLSANLQLGLTGYSLSYAPGSPGQRQGRAGAGFDGALTTEQGQVFLEAAAPSGRQPAVIGGARFGAARLRTFILLRQYGRDYAAPRCNAIASFGGRDEQGATIGSALPGLPFRTTASALYDYARPLSPQGGLDRGHGRSAIESFVANSLIPGLQLEWRWRRTVNEDVGADLASPFRSSRRTASRVGLRWRTGSLLAVTARYEVDRVREDGNAEAPRGDLLTIGISGGAWRGLRLAAATIFFTAASYDARLYATEPELTGAGSFHAYFGTGRRDVLLLKYSYRRSLGLECKVARQQRDYQGASQRQTEGGLAIDLRY